MRPVGRRRMTLLDAVLLVGSAAVGLGLFELSHRTLFKGQIWLADHGVPNFQTWSTMEVLVLCSDIAAFLLPVVAPWTFLLIALRMRQRRPAWRRVWQQLGNGRVPGSGRWLALDRLAIASGHERRARGTLGAVNHA